MSHHRRWHVQMPVEGERPRVIHVAIVVLGLLGFVLLPGAGAQRPLPATGVWAGAAQPAEQTAVRRSRSTDPSRTVVRADTAPEIKKTAHGPGPYVVPAQPTTTRRQAPATRYEADPDGIPAAPPDGPEQGRAPPFSRDI